MCSKAVIGKSFGKSVINGKSVVSRVRHSLYCSANFTAKNEIETMTFLLWCWITETKCLSARPCNSAETVCAGSPKYLTNSACSSMWCSAYFFIYAQNSLKSINGDFVFSA